VTSVDGTEGQVCDSDGGAVGRVTPLLRTTVPLILLFAPWRLNAPSIVSDLAIMWALTVAGVTPSAGRVIVPPPGWGMTRPSAWDQ
jgi:hypothetical protein